MPTLTAFIHEIVKDISYEELVKMREEAEEEVRLLIRRKERTVRLIDADFLKEWVDEYLSVFKKYDKGTIKGFVDHAPTIEPKRGEWIRTFDGNEWYWYCSNCKEQWYEDDLWMGGNEFPNFCPNCGADMRKGADDE